MGWIAGLAGGCGYRPDAEWGVPYGLLAVMLIVVPLFLAVFLGLFAFSRMTPLVFRCRRCDREFRRAPHLAFPDLCPHCRARDWNQARAP